MTVIITSSPSRSLKLVPKMMFASGSAAARISSAASVTSNRLRLDEPVMLNRMPWAPAMLTSSSGLAIAWRAASTARFSPRRPADPHERRAGVLHDRPDVGEVEVDQARHRDDVADPLDALAEDVVDDPERVEDQVFFWTTSLSRSFGIVISVSTWALSSSAAFSAIELALGALER